MRIGQNPAKSLKTVAQPERVTVAIITYIPVLSGYYAESLDVLKVCLNSLWENTRTPYDLLVFDNASCPQVRDFLTAARDEGRIQYLVLSERNIGKAGAWNFIFGAAPGEVIAYADSDVYFYPGWLAAHLEVLDSFPQVGMVTGMPMWTPHEFSTATVAWAERTPGVQVQRGRYLPWGDYWRHARSLGAEESKARAHYEANDVLCLLAGEKRYYIGAAHFQFVSPKAALQSVLPIPSRRPMGEVRLLDIALNEKGYLRLCTPEWWVQHLGNTLGADAPVGAVKTSKVRRRRRGGFWRFGPVQRLLRGLYHFTFEKLYRS